MKNARFVGSFGLLSTALMILGMGLVVPASAQHITRATAESPHAGRWEVHISLDQGFDAQSGKALNNYVLLEVETGKRLEIVDIRSTSDLTPSVVTLLLSPETQLQGNQYYHLFIFHLAFAGKPSVGPLESPVKFAGAGQHPNVKQGRSFQPADGRDDANFYFSGEITRTKEKDFQGSVDAKLEYPFARTYWDRVHYFGPSFDLKASNDPSGDPDSMNIGFWWRWRVLRLPVPFRYLNWRNNPKIEATRNFNNANLLLDSRFSLLSKVWFNSHGRFFFQPFMGVELGRNVRSPVPEPARLFRSRPQIGTSANLVFTVEKPGLREISFESSYIRRWPLRKEVSFKTDAAGNLVPLPIGTSPRDYVTVKLNIGFLQGFGSTVGYEWGQLPPLYNLIDHKLSIGLTYKIKVAAGEE